MDREIPETTLASPRPPITTRIPRVAYLALAWVSLALAILGALLPVLPTTPFVLLAAWAAARGSSRLHARLLAHRTFGPMIAQWEASGAVSRRAKRVAIAAMAASGAIVWIVSPRPWVPPLVTAILLAVALWLWRRPEPPA